MNEQICILIMKDALSINLIDVHVVTGIQNEQHTVTVLMHKY